MDEHITSWAVSVGLDILDNAGLADCREEEVHAVAASLVLSTVQATPYLHTSLLCRVDTLPHSGLVCNP